MGLAQYHILPQGDEWGVLHDGHVRNMYVTKEAAFEAGPLLSVRDMKARRIKTSKPPQATMSSFSVVWA